MNNTIAKLTITGLFSIVAYLGLEYGGETGDVVSAMSVCVAVFHWLFWPVNNRKSCKTSQDATTTKRMKSARS